jgi:hypothetical protein
VAATCLNVVRVVPAEAPSASAGRGWSAFDLFDLGGGMFLMPGGALLLQ